MKKQTDTPLTERKVVRRGLIAGLAGLGAAAMFKVSGADKAAALDNQPLLMGNAGNTATLTTKLNVNPAFPNTSGFTVNSGMNLDADKRTGIVGAAGTAQAAPGVGVWGACNNSGPNVFGVLGQADNGIGVNGTSSSGVGVQGQSASGYGVYGASAGSAIGVLGLTSSGTGVWGQSSSYVGVIGYALTGAIGVYGTSQSIGAGVFGESVAGIGVVALGRTANVPALSVENTALGAGKVAATFVGNVFINGNYTATGTKLAIVPHPDGSMRSLYCTEATEPLFEDYGRAQLVGGVAKVRIDPDFAPLVHRTAYHVFPVAEGDCRGLFVSRQDANSFEVRELQGGKSSVPFSYRVVAKRADVVGERLKRVTPEMLNVMKGQASAARNAARPAGPLNPPAGAPAPGTSGHPVR